MAFPLLLSGSTQEQMVGDLDNIKNAIKISYAPAEWKTKFSGWNLDNEIDNAKENVISSAGKMSTKEFQRLVKKFLNSTKDYHVSVAFHSTEKASLPFSVKGAAGKYFISHINRKKLGSSSFPFSEGDELLLFDGRPVEEVINELLRNETNSNEQTDRALAEIYLTHRSGKLGQIVPKGPITITILPTRSAKPYSHQLIWDYKKEKISRSPISITPPLSNLSKSQRVLTAKKKKFIEDPIFQKLLLVNDLTSEEEDGDKATDFLSSRNGFLPTLGRLWWKSSEDCPFNAYLFELSDHRLVGYVRIPTFMPSSADDLEEFAANVEINLKEFAKIISFMEERSEALVIDQMNNPGGSLFYLYALAAMLTDQPLATPKHRTTITQSDVYSAVSKLPLLESINSDRDARSILGESFWGIPVTHQVSQFILNFFRFIVEEWHAGRHVTDPYFLFGIDHINPNSHIGYTKPILVLINSLDFSGGDFFPAILQDNQRATLMGARTAGAGGFITKLKFPNLNGIAEVRITGSIAERSDKSPLENLGVTPDIPYVITENDLRYNYEDYAEAIRDALGDLLGKTKMNE